MTDCYENLRALYQEARPDEEPTRADVRAVRTAMMSAGIAAVTFHASSAAGKLLALAPGGAKLFTLGQVVTYTAIGVAIGGGVAVVGVSVQRNATTHAAASISASVQRAPAIHKAPAAPLPEQPEAEPPEAAETERAGSALQNSAAPLPAAAPIRSIQPPRVAPIPSEEPPEPPASPPEERSAPQAQSLMHESRGLLQVQVALGSGDASRALQLLDEQDQAFRGGILTQERAAARVIALCTAQRPDAEAAKERFVSAYPGSPLVRRVSAACKNR